MCILCDFDRNFGCFDIKFFTVSIDLQHLKAMLTFLSNYNVSIDMEQKIDKTNWTLGHFLSLLLF